MLIIAVIKLYYACTYLKFSLGSDQYNFAATKLHHFHCRILIHNTVTHSRQTEENCNKKNIANYNNKLAPPGRRNTSMCSHFQANLYSGRSPCKSFYANHGINWFPEVAEGAWIQLDSGECTTLSNMLWSRECCAARIAVRWEMGTDIA